VEGARLSDTLFTVTHELMFVAILCRASWSSRRVILIQLCALFIHVP